MSSPHRPAAGTNPTAALAHVEQSREQLREEARRALGVTGRDDSELMPLRQTLRANGVSAYPLAALGLLAIVDTFSNYAFAVLTPEISRSLGIGKGAIAGLIALKTLAIAVAPLPIAALAQHRARRAMLCLATAMVWSATTIWLGYVTLAWGLLIALIVDGISTGSTAALHQPLLFDSYPPQARVRTLSTYFAADSVGNVIAPLLVALLVGHYGFTWRGVFVAMGCLSFCAVAIASRLRDPGFGRWDTDRIRQTVRRHHDEAVTRPHVTDDEARLGFFEIVRRLMLIPSARRFYVAFGVFGVLLIPYRTFLFFFLDERWNVGPAPRALIFASMATVAIACLAAFGRHGERLFGDDPAKVVRLAGLLLAAAVVCIGLGGASPWFGGMLVMFGLSAGLIAVVSPAIYSGLLSVIPAHMRPHATALAGIFVGGVGGIAGALFLSGIDRRFGVTGSMVALVIPGVTGSLLLASAGKFIPGDLDRMIDAVVEDEEIRRISESGGHLPMLACRGVDYFYGQMQVLFDVDFTVDDGEIVALLGVNGAGKSTLLKAISGIGLPPAGSVRLRGVDITHLDAERRLRLGITQVPGGRAVFGPLTVAENLRTYGYALGRRHADINAATDRCFDAFPRLAERRNQLASTLSGGEQQMLALSKALILRPRLLLIDELSLGLAPVVVAQLLDMVRQINADGTAVVLVEQSVNIALNLVEHAYFMEKGEMRFDGAAADLLARADLLRAVFLDGASKRTAEATQ